MNANVLGGHYRGLELPALALGFVITAAAVVMLVFTGPKGLGWVLLPFGSVFAIPASYRANRRAAAARPFAPSRRPSTGVADNDSA